MNSTFLVWLLVSSPPGRFSCIMLRPKCSTPSDFCPNSCCPLRLHLNFRTSPRCNAVRDLRSTCLYIFLWTSYLIFIRWVTCTTHTCKSDMLGSKSFYEFFHTACCDAQRSVLIEKLWAEQPNVHNWPVLNPQLFAHLLFSKENWMKHIIKSSNVQICAGCKEEVSCSMFIQWPPPS